MSLPQDGADGHSRGFTLVELLVVMLIIGVLAAIAIPVFLSQREKAHDSSTKADVSILGKEVAAYFVDGKGPLSLDFLTTPGSVVLTDGSYSSQVRLTNGTAQSANGGARDLDKPTAWCVSLTDVGGRQKEYRYSATAGLESGNCS